MIRITEIQSLQNVRPAALDEHHRLAGDILDDQRLPFVAAQGAARLRPHHVEAFDVAGIDVFERAVAGLIQVTRRGTPLIGVFEALELLGIRRGHRGTTGRH